MDTWDRNELAVLFKATGMTGELCLTKDHLVVLESVVKENYETRLFLLLNHGHAAPYTDDGELQCAECRPNWDYKILPITTLLIQLLTPLHEQIAALETQLKTIHRLQDKYPNGAYGCCCLFDDEETQIEWCKAHGELRDKAAALTEELRLANLRSESLDRVVSDSTEEYVVLRAENEGLKKTITALKYLINNDSDAKGVGNEQNQTLQVPEGRTEIGL
jgi:hypothetical protein